MILTFFSPPSEAGMWWWLFDPLLTGNSLSINIDKGLISAWIYGEFDIDVAHENMPYKPTGQTPYAEVIVLQNDITPATLNDSNDTDGVFRVILRYPVNTGAIAPKVKADQIFSVFRIGTRIVYDGVMLTIMANQRGPGLAENGWYKLVLDMPYRANIKRI